MLPEGALGFGAHCGLLARRQDAVRRGLGKPVVLPRLAWRDATEARADLAAWLTRWQDKHAKFCAWVEANIDETFAFYRLPKAHHKHLKSTNLLERLNQPMASGIGLANVRERLRVIYGATYHLTIDSEPGRGTRARIEVPELVDAERITA